MLDQAPQSPAADDVSRAMLDRLAQAGYSRIEPPVLQNAANFLDLGGEAIRSSLYFTSDRSGAELCLRPEYTIPVCRAYLASGSAGETASFSYCGPVFRFRSGGSGEVVQAGLESYGRGDIAAADAEILSLSLEAVEAGGCTGLQVRFGDAGLLAGVLDGLKLPANWQRRLKRGLDQGESTETILIGASTGPGDHSGVLAALAGADESGARALVNDLLSIAGIVSVGGRSADEIAERFLNQVALRSAPPFAAEQRTILDAFLALSGDPDEAALSLRKLSDDAKLDLSDRLDLFEERTSFIAAHGVDLASVSFEAAFGRKLDYYTGFVFEARQIGVVEGPVVGGGRYDRLAEALGHPTPIPAVGAAIWLDRIREPDDPRESGEP